jgi:hypothetical protein
MEMIIQVLKNPLTRKILLSSAILVGSGVSIYFIRKGISEYVIPLLLKNFEKKLPHLSKEDIEVLLDILDVLSVTLFVAATSVVALQYVTETDLIPYLLVELAKVGSVTNEEAQEAYQKILKFLFKEKKNFFSMDSFKDEATYQKFLNQKFEGLLHLISVGNGENSRFRNLKDIANLTNEDVEKLSRLVYGLYKRLMHSADFLSVPFALKFLKVGHPLDENHIEKLMQIIRLLEDRFANRVKYLAFLFKAEVKNIRDLYLELLKMDSGELKEFLKFANLHLSYLQYQILVYLIKLYFIILSIYREGLQSLLKYYMLVKKPYIFRLVRPKAPSSSFKDIYIRNKYFKKILEKFVRPKSAYFKNVLCLVVVARVLFKFTPTSKYIPFSRLLK